MNSGKLFNLHVCPRKSQGEHLFVSFSRTHTRLSAVTILLENRQRKRERERERMCVRSKTTIDETSKGVCLPNRTFDLGKQSVARALNPPLVWPHRLDARPSASSSVRQRLESWRTKIRVQGSCGIYSSLSLFLILFFRWWAQRC